MSRASGNFSGAVMLTLDADACKADPLIDPVGSLVEHMIYVMIGPMTELSVAATTQVVTHGFTDTASATLRVGSGETGKLTAIGVAQISTESIPMAKGRNLSARHKPAGIHALAAMMDFFHATREKIVV